VERLSGPGKSFHNLGRVTTAFDILKLASLARSSFGLCQRSLRVFIGVRVGLSLNLALGVIGLKSSVLVKVLVPTQVLPEASVLKSKQDW
jgi:hypothetical protein